MQQQKNRVAHSRRSGAARRKQPKRLFRRDAEDRARNGVIPRPPDFSAATHRGYRARLRRLVELVKAGDVRALKRESFRSNATSPRALGKYRDLAVLAMQTRRAAE